MLKITRQEREWLAELRSGGGWACLLLFAVLLATPRIVGGRFGSGWSLATAVVALGLWLAIRPWRFGLFSPRSRQGIRLNGIVGLAGSLLSSLIAFFQQH